MGLASVGQVGPRAVVTEFKEVVLGGGLTIVALSTDETARPNGPDSVTRCVAVVKGSVVGLCQLMLGVATVLRLVL